MGWVIIHFVKRNKSNHLNVTDVNIEIMIYKIHPVGLKLVNDIWYLEALDEHSKLCRFNMANICSWRQLHSNNLNNKPKQEVTKHKSTKPSKFSDWSINEDSTVINGTIEFT